MGVVLEIFLLHFEQAFSHRDLSETLSSSDIFSFELEIRQQIF